MKIKGNFLGKGAGTAKQKNLQLGVYGYFLELHNTGLCSNSASVPQATNFCFQATRKTYCLQNLTVGHPKFHGWDPAYLYIR